MRSVYAFIVGGLFGAGLLLSGMTDTVKIQGWLDLFGDWDPTLAFVMGGAIIPMAIAWRFTNGRKPVLGGEFPAQSDPRISKNLAIGSIFFGMGWGLSGLWRIRRYCFCCRDDFWDGRCTICTVLSGRRTGSRVNTTLWILDKSRPTTLLARKLIQRTYKLSPPLALRRSSAIALMRKFRHHTMLM